MMNNIVFICYLVMTFDRIMRSSVYGVRLYVAVSSCSETSAPAKSPIQRERINNNKHPCNYANASEIQ